jgi:hypothetical protein
MISKSLVSLDNKTISMQFFRSLLKAFKTIDQLKRLTQVILLTNSKEVIHHDPTAKQPSKQREKQK